MPAPPTDRLRSAQGAPDAPWNASPPRDQRWLLVVLMLGTVVLLWVATAAFLWRDRHLTLEATSTHTSRQALRLSQDLDQTLKVARTSIAQFDERLQRASTTPFQASPSTEAEANAELLAALPLPFELHVLAPEGHTQALVGLLNPSKRLQPEHHNGGKPLPPGTWSLGSVEFLTGQQTLPLSWPATPNLHRVTGYGVDLSFASLQNWLDRDRKLPDDRVSLFWLNDDGSATLLARSPNVPERLGRRVTADWVAPALQQPSGVLDLVSQIDQHHRRVAYHRLAGAASSLVIVYGADIPAALSAWRAQLPFLVGLVLLLSLAMGFGGWRLNRALRALTLGEKRFQLVLDSGHVWDWDIPSNKMRYTQHFLARQGYTNEPHESKIDALFEHIEPEDGLRLKTALNNHLATGERYAETFRTRDAQGHIHWFETQGQAFWDSDGQARYMAGTAFEITSRQMLEDTQRQILKRLDTVANASPVLYWTSNLSGQVDWVNHRWLEFTGRDEEEELGHGWLDGIHPDDRERTREAMATTLIHQRPFAMEFRLRFRDGSHRWVMEQCRPLLDADQMPIGFIGSCLDLTALKQAEADARQRGAMLESVFTVLQDMLFVMDMEGRIVSYHSAADDILYVPPEAFMGRTAAEVLPPDVAALINRELALVAPGQMREFEYTLELPQGLRRFNARLARLPDSDHSMLVARDITERESLRRQRERLQQFMALQARLATRFINLPVAELDHDIGLALGEIGAFVQADRAYIFAYDLQSQTASNTHEWCASGIEPAIDQLQDLPMDLIPQWVDAHMRQEAFGVDDVQSLPPGPLREILEPQGIRSLIALPMSASSGLLGFVGFDSVHATHEYTPEEVALLSLFAEMLVNVLGRQRSEAQLHQLTTELEMRVKERTQQLDTSVKRLSQANRELESFAYSVSHDLKSPVRSVEGFTALLLEDHGARLDDEARDYLQRIQRSAHHMARLINDLLAYARIEQMDTLLAAVPLARTAGEVVDALHNDIEASGGRVQLLVAEDLAVRAHPQGLAMVLRNLIDNALKFKRPGVPPEITIEATSQADKVHISVKDHGQGFDMKYHDRIFAIFQRLHRPDEVSGTGIGLAMVHKAVERMDGRIWAESAPGQGSTFHIELPRA
ncbi:PAS domain-containing protein [Hydrogenophaga sp. PAMC20947]|uniref:PAS domain-containing protein n=1 Tax=Hydrogenophaga sp. PAMC20947 TaxID=2565558 RepID=UPI00109DDAB4|nr:PAS domain-containing protein [Hydrogenophaga sp. PAMC20947]QCB48086.1 PAS domain S-box protein [Hydrogenophaga sp. PAMC20947]